MPPAAGEIDEALEICLQTIDGYEQMQKDVERLRDETRALEKIIVDAMSPHSPEEKEPSLDDGAGQGACDFTIQEGIDLCKHIAEELRQYSPRMASKWERIAAYLSEFVFVLRSLEKNSSQEEVGDRVR